MASEQQRRDNTTKEREYKEEEHKVPHLVSRFEVLTEKAQGSEGSDNATGHEYDGAAAAKHASSNVVASSHGRGGDQMAGKGSERGRQIKPDEGARLESNAAAKVTIRGTVSGCEAEKAAEGRTGSSGGVDIIVKGVPEAKQQKQEGKVAEYREGQKQKEKREVQSKKGRSAHADYSGGERYSVGKFEAAPEGEQTGRKGPYTTNTTEGTKKKEGGRGGGTYKGESEEISEYRQKAQQNSIDAIQGAEQRYNKAKDDASEVKEPRRGHGGMGTAKTYAAQLGSQTQDTLKSGYQTATQYVTEKGAPVKDTALEKAQQGYVTTKDTVAGAGRSAMDYTKQTADYATQKAGDVKDSTLSATQKTSKIAGEKAGQAKDTAKSVAGYLGEKTVATGKGAASLTGKVASVVKDSAVVAGWEAAHLTAEAAVGATKMTAGVVKGAAEYAGKASGMVVGAGEKAMEFAENQAAAAKDAAISAGESAADYSARRRMEAQQNFQATKSEIAEGTKGEEQLSTGGSMEEHSGGQSGSSITNRFLEGKRDTSQKKDTTGKAAAGEYKMGEGVKASHETGNMWDSAESMSASATGVLDAVGETVVEIAAHTKNLLVGSADDQTEEEGETRGARRAS